MYICSLYIRVLAINYESFQIFILVIETKVVVSLKIVILFFSTIGAGHLCSCGFKYFIGKKT